MDTWIVSRNPIGLSEIYPPTAPAETAALPKVLISSSPAPESLSHGLKTCVFFLKAHIMAGQVKPGKSVTDFAWLTKKEIAKRVDERYWHGIKDMLSDF
jgi:large subunit ribosomal protein L46